MSEPVREPDIEDVLSSIRRLVSEEGRPVAKSQVPEIKEKTSDRLVLTPALRVAEVMPEQAAVPSKEHAPEPKPEQPQPVQEQPTVEDFVDDVKEVDASQAKDDAPEVAVKPAQDRAERQPEFRHQSDRQEARRDEGQSAPTDAKSADEPMDQTAAETGSAGLETDEVADNPAEDGAWQDNEPADMAIADATGADQAETDKSDGDIRLEDRIAGLEAAVAGRDDQWEPDGASDDEYSGGPVESLPWEDSDTTRKPRQPEPVMEEADEAEAYGDDEQTEAFAAAEDEIDDRPAADLFAAEDTILDEETLRELVAEIVRQELQGSLGERITRNVRKLVRREIHRALASQDLE